MTLALSTFSDPSRGVMGTGVGLLLNQEEGALTHGYRTQKMGRESVARIIPKIEQIVEKIGPTRIVCDEDLAWAFYTIPHTVVEAGSNSRLRKMAQKLARAKLYGVELKKAVLIGDEISNKRAQLIHITAKKSGYSELGIRKMLAEYGLVSTKEVTTDIFQAVISKARSKTLAKLYNDKAHANHAKQ